MTDEQLADLRHFVKPLEWMKGKAETKIGSYIVVCEDWDDEPFWFIYRGGKVDGKLGEHSSEEAAKAAAQADYADRILSAVPDLLDEVVRLRKANANLHKVCKGYEDRLNTQFQARTALGGAND